MHYLAAFAYRFNRRFDLRSKDLWHATFFHWEGEHAIQRHFSDLIRSMSSGLLSPSESRCITLAHSALLPGSGGRRSAFATSARCGDDRCTGLFAGWIADALVGVGGGAGTGPWSGETVATGAKAGPAACAAVGVASTALAGATAGDGLASGVTGGKANGATDVVAVAGWGGDGRAGAF